MKKNFTLLTLLLWACCSAYAQISGEANPSPCKEYQYTVSGTGGRPGSWNTESGLSGLEYLSPVNQTTVKAKWYPFSSGMSGKITFSYYDANNNLVKLTKDITLSKGVGEVTSMTNSYTNNAARSISIDACNRDLITFTVPAVQNATRYEWSTTTGWQSNNSTIAQITYNITNGNGGTVKVKAVNGNCSPAYSSISEYTVTISRTGGGTLSWNAPATITPGQVIVVNATVNAPTSFYTWESDEPAILLNGQAGSTITNVNTVSLSNTLPAEIANRNKFKLKLTANSTCGVLKTEKIILDNVPVGGLISFQPDMHAVKLNTPFRGDFGYDRFAYLEENNSGEIQQIEWQYNSQDLTMTDRNGDPLNFVPAGASIVTVKKFTNNKVTFNARAKNVLGWGAWRTFTLVNADAVSGPPEAELIRFQLDGSSTVLNANERADFGYNKLPYLDTGGETAGILEMDWEFNPADMTIVATYDPLAFVTKSAVVLNVKRFVNGMATFRVKARNSAGWSGWKTINIYQGTEPRFPNSTARLAAPAAGVMNESAESFLVKPVLSSNKASTLLQVYPNPVNNILTVQLPGKHTTSPVSLELYDQKGSIIFRKFSTGPKVSFDVSGISPGVYILTVKYEGKLYTRNVVKI